MNNTLKKLMMALALCGALCGTATAAPKGGTPAKGKAPAAMTAKALLNSSLNKADNNYCPYLHGCKYGQ